MDDPISALDAAVRKKIMQNLVMGHLKQKTRILVTHAIDYVHMADKIIIMDKGQIVGQGSYDELKDNEILGNLVKMNNINKQSPVKENELSQSSTSSTEGGKVNQADIQTMVSNSTMKATFADEITLSEKLEYFEKIGRVSKDNNGKIVQDEDDEVVHVGLGTYWRFLKESKSTWVFFVIVLFVFLEYFSGLVANNAVGEWANDTENQQAHFKYYVTITCCSYAAYGIIIASYHYMRYYINLRISRNMHDNMLKTVLKAPINLFFDVTPSGTVINRFSNDIDVVDNQISGTLVAVLSLSCCVAASVIQMAYANYRLLGLVPVLVACTYALYRH